MFGLPFSVSGLLSNTIYLKVKVVTDFLFSLSALICVPGMVFMGIYWVASPGTNMRVHSSTSERIIASPGEVTQVKGDVNLQTGSKQLVYHFKLIDSNNNVKYRYPDIPSKNKVQLQDINIKLPANIAPGDYSLVAEVQYLANPLRMNTTELELATINIADRDKRK